MMNNFERVLPDPDASGRWPPPPLLVAREFDETTLCLRLPEADAVELNPAAVAAIRAAKLRPEEKPATPKSLEDPELGAGLGAHRDWVISAVAEGWQQPAAFAPGWEAPADFSPPAFASLPGEADWLLLVAATARPARALRAWGEWQSRGLRGQRLVRRLRPVLAANLASASSGPAKPLAGGAAARRCWQRNTIAFHRVAPVLRLLAEADVRVALLKGAAVALVDYRDLALRLMADIDLVVPWADRPRARAVLEAAGFRAHQPVDERLAARAHGGAFVRPEYLNLDLHWHALWTNCWVGADDRLWATAQPGRVHDAPVWIPSPELRLLNICVHGLRDQPIPSHHWVVDAAAILTTQGGRLDWDGLLAEARARRVTRTVREACSYLADALGAPIPPAVRRQLERAPTAVFENLIFESYQRPFPAGGPIRATLVSWLNQYRAAARGFRPRELAEFLTAMRLARGHDSTLRFLWELLYGAVRKFRSGRRQPPVTPLPS